MYSTPKPRQPREAATATAAAELKTSSWTSSAEPTLLCSPAVSMPWTNNRKRFSRDYFPLKQYQKRSWGSDHPRDTSREYKDCEAGGNTCGIDEPLVLQ